MEGVRCEDCGNADPARFHRIYVEESRERLVDGEWTVESAWEYAGGSETYTECEVCGSTAVDERYADTQVPSSLDAAERAEAARRAVIDSYKEHLRYEASLGFRYRDAEDRWLGALHKAHLEGALAVAEAVGSGVGRDTVIETAAKELVPDLRSELPGLRETAARPFVYSPVLYMTDEERAHNAGVAAARERLEHNEAALAALEARPEHQSSWWPDDDQLRDPHEL